MSMWRSSVRALFVRALASGGRQIGPFTVEWEIHGKCLMPVRREIAARKARSLSLTRWGFQAKRFPDIFSTMEDTVMTSDRKVTTEYFKDENGPYSVLLTVKCRRCDNCRKERRNKWALRAMCEIAQSSRTWFGTATLSPEWQARFGLQAAEAARKRGLVLEALSFDEQFLLRHRQITREFTLIFKRMRKERHQFRYMLVVEPHTGDGENGGLPHYHLLVHEIGAPISKRVLEAAWPFGFTTWRLAQDGKPSWYVAKYLGKVQSARVRASLHYGRLRAALAVDRRGDQVDRVNPTAPKKESF